MTIIRLLRRCSVFQESSNTVFPCVCLLFTDQLSSSIYRATDFKSSQLKTSLTCCKSIHVGDLSMKLVSMVSSFKRPQLSPTSTTKPTLRHLVLNTLVACFFYNWCFIFILYSSTTGPGMLRPAYTASRRQVRCVHLANCSATSCQRAPADYDGARYAKLFLLVTKKALRLLWFIYHFYFLL